MRFKAKYDWSQLEKEFIEGVASDGADMNLNDFAKLHNIPYQSVRTKAAERNWHGKRLTYYMWGKYEGQQVKDPWGNVQK